MSTGVFRRRWNYSQPAAPSQFLATGSGRHPYLFIDAEDFNTEGGQYFPSNPAFGHSFNAFGLYSGKTAVEDVDFHSGAASSDLYRVSTGVPITEHSDDRHIPDYYVLMDAGDPDWFNYTRTFPAGLYKVWVRVSGNSAEDVGNLSFVTSDRSLPDQTLDPIGDFAADIAEGWEWVPVVVGAEPVVVELDGELTLRVSGVGGILLVHALRFEALNVGELIGPGHGAGTGFGRLRGISSLRTRGHGIGTGGGKLSGTGRARGVGHGAGSSGGHLVGSGELSGIGHGAGDGAGVLEDGTVAPTDIVGSGHGTGSGFGELGGSGKLAGIGHGSGDGAGEPSAAASVRGIGHGAGNGVALLVFPPATIDIRGIGHGTGIGVGDLDGAAALLGASHGVGNGFGELTAIIIADLSGVGHGTGLAISGLLEPWQCGEFGVPFLYLRRDWTEDTDFYLEVYFRATSGTAKAILTDITTGQHVGLSVVSTSSADFDRIRSAAFTLQDGHEYMVCFGGGGSGEYKSAKLFGKVP